MTTVKATMTDQFNKQAFEKGELLVWIKDKDSEQQFLEFIDTQTKIKWFSHSDEDKALDFIPSENQVAFPYFIQCNGTLKFEPNGKYHIAYDNMVAFELKHLNCSLISTIYTWRQSAYLDYLEECAIPFTGEKLTPKYWNVEINIETGEVEESMNNKTKQEEAKRGFETVGNVINNIQKGEIYTRSFDYVQTNVKSIECDEFGFIRLMLDNGQVAVLSDLHLYVKEEPQLKYELSELMNFGEEITKHLACGGIVYSYGSEVFYKLDGEELVGTHDLQADEVEWESTIDSLTWFEINDGWAIVTLNE